MQQHKFLTDIIDIILEKNLMDENVEPFMALNEMLSIISVVKFK